jgi:hypothetical protein
MFFKKTKGDIAMKKFELTAETKNVRGVTLYRIRALVSIFGIVDQGGLGGFVAGGGHVHLHVVGSTPRP